MSPFLLLCLSLPLISATVSLEEHEGKFITYCFQKSFLFKKEHRFLSLELFRL